MSERDLADKNIARQANTRLSFIKLMSAHSFGYRQLTVSSLLPARYSPQFVPRKRNFDFKERRDKTRVVTETDLNSQKKLETFTRRVTRRLATRRDDQVYTENDIPEQAIHGTEKKDVAIQRIKKRENEMNVAFFAYLNNHIHSLGVHQIIAFDHVTTNLSNGYNQLAGDFRDPLMCFFNGKMTMADVNALIEKCPYAEIATCGEILLSGLDVSTLNPNTCLNDQVINGYMSLIATNYRDVAALDVFFQCLVSGKSPEKFVNRDLFNKGTILVPVIYRIHWTLLVIHEPEATIHVYNSMTSGGRHPAEMLRRYMNSRGDASYVVRTVEDLPQQTNNEDCGVFVCQYALCLAAGKSGKGINFAPDDDVRVHCLQSFVKKRIITVN